MNSVCVRVRARAQELLCREEELKRAALEQKSHEEFLRLREQQLAQWEQDVFERELSLLILHLNQNQEKPNVKKRKGTFKKHKLKCKNGEKISMPQGRFHQIGLQPQAHIKYVWYLSQGIFLILPCDNCYTGNRKRCAITWSF